MGGREADQAMGILLGLGKVLFSMFLAYLFVVAVVIAFFGTCTVVLIPTSSFGVAVPAGLVVGGLTTYLLGRGMRRVFSWLWRRPNVH
jgi:multidrug efflux pump subunit AcrB